MAYPAIPLELALSGNGEKISTHESSKSVSPLAVSGIVVRPSDKNLYDVVAE